MEAAGAVVKAASAGYQRLRGCVTSPRSIKVGMGGIAQLLSCDHFVSGELSAARLQ
jgi:hypothetical protein